MRADLDEADALRLADPVDAAPRQLPFVGEIEQPVLETGRTEIGDEDLHDLDFRENTIGWERNCKMKSEKCKLQIDEVPRRNVSRTIANLPFSICILHFAITESNTVVSQPA